MTDDFYDLLGVDREASREEIRRAYRRQVRIYHPDLNDDPRAPAQFTALKKAYETLGDPKERDAYERMGHEEYVRNRISGLPSPDQWQIPGRNGTRAPADPRSEADAGDERPSGDPDGRSGSRQKEGDGAAGTRPQGGDGPSAARKGDADGPEAGPDDAEGERTRDGDRSGPSSRATGGRSVWEPAPDGSATGSDVAGGTGTGGGRTSNGSTGGSSDSRASGGGSGPGSNGSRSGPAAGVPSGAGSARDPSRAGTRRAETQGAGTPAGHSRGTASATGSGSGARAGSAAGSSRDRIRGVRERFDPGRLVRRARRVSLGWPLIALADALYLLGLAFYLGANADGVARIVEAALTGGVDAGRAALESGAGVEPLPVFVRADVAAGAAVGGLLVIAGAAALPSVYFFIIRETRVNRTPWRPSYLYVVGALAPLGGMVLDLVVTEPGLYLELVAYVLLPVGAVLGLPFSAFCWPRIKRFFRRTWRKFRS